MKPANVILRPDGTVCLIDFGIAGQLRAKHLPNPQDATMNIGSPGYAAPEQWSELATSDVTTDVYGLSAMLHELLTGEDPATRAPFMFPKPSKLRKGIKPELEAIIMRGLEMDQAERWPAVKDLRLALEGFLGQAGNQSQNAAPLANQLVTPTTFQTDPELLGIFGQIKMPIANPSYYARTVLDNQRASNQQAYVRLQQYCLAGLLEEAFREAERLVKAVRQLANQNDAEKNIQDEFLFILGKLEEARGNLERAKKAYQESIACDPTRQLAYQALSRIKQAPLLARAKQQAARVQAAQTAASRRQAAFSKVRSLAGNYWQVLCHQFSLADAADRLSGSHSFLLATAITVGGQIGLRAYPEFIPSLDGWAWAGIAGMILFGWALLECFFGLVKALFNPLASPPSGERALWSLGIVVAATICSALWWGNGSELDEYWSHGESGERGEIFNTLAEVEPNEPLASYRGRLQTASTIATYEEYTTYITAHRELIDAQEADRISEIGDKVTRANLDLAQERYKVAVQALKVGPPTPSESPISSPEGMSDARRDHRAGWLLLF